MYCGTGTGNGKNKGPGHGHGNKGKGGGGAYGNNLGLTISQARQIYANQLAEGFSLQQAMATNPANTVNFFNLIDDTQTNNNQNTTMALDLNSIYDELLNRTPDASGAAYWQNQYDTATAGGQSSADAIQDIKNAFMASQEYQGLQNNSSNTNNICNFRFKSCTLFCSPNLLINKESMSSNTTIKLC